MTPVTGKAYVEETLNVNEIEVDHNVQRQALNITKVTNIKKNFNPAALGVITVSKRTLAGKQVQYIALDGMHRVQAVKELTDNTGTVVCHVFEGLTLAEEAQMFLDLNHTTQPRLMDKFFVQCNAEGEEGDAARDIRDIVYQYGWSISHVPANGNINCVGTLKKLHELSVRTSAEPNLVHAMILTITRAWGNDRAGVNSTIVEGIGRMFAEYGSLLELDRLVNTLKEYKGGPVTLHAEAQQYAAIKRGRVAMAIAEMLVESYNKGLRGGRVLSAWRKRS